MQQSVIKANQKATKLMPKTLQKLVDVVNGPHIKQMQGQYNKLVSQNISLQQDLNKANQKYSDLTALCAVKGSLSSCLDEVLSLSVDEKTREVFRLKQENGELRAAIHAYSDSAKQAQEFLQLFDENKRLKERLEEFENVKQTA